MPEIIEVRPDYNGTQEASSYYFYSTYNPTEHFEYKVIFKWNNSTQQEEIDATLTEAEKLKAYRKAIEYHFGFEQVLPEEDDKYIKFYRPSSISLSNNDFIYRQKNFETITKEEFESQVLTQLEELETKTMKISGDDGLAIDPSTVETAQNSRYMGEKDYSQMSIEELSALVLRWTSTAQKNGYNNATEWNKYCYENAVYCYIKRPTRLNSSAYVSPYDFRKVLRQVNSIFGFKLPVEEGWYRYNTYTKKWEYLNFKESEVNG